MNRSVIAVRIRKLIENCKVHKFNPNHASEVNRLVNLLTNTSDRIYPCHAYGIEYFYFRVGIICFLG